MRDPIAKYLEDVLCYADLAAADERNVRAELSEHLHELAAPAESSNPIEVYAMLKDQFGTPKRVGRAIAAAKGRRADILVQENGQETSAAPGHGAGAGHSRCGNAWLRCFMSRETVSPPPCRGGAGCLFISWRNRSIRVM